MLSARKGKSFSMGSVLKLRTHQEAGSASALALHRRRGHLTLWAVTCHHVLASGEIPIAHLPGGVSATPQLEALYPDIDLALLRLELPEREAKTVRPLPLASAVRAAPGQTVYALGIPAEAEEPRLLAGILRRVEPDCLEFHCGEALSGGWSGGALLDGRGRVLGIIQAVGNGGHTGYALPGAALESKVLDPPMARVLRRPAGPLRWVRRGALGSLRLCGVLFLLGILFLWLMEPFNDRRLKALAPQLSHLSYAITYESGASLQTALRRGSASRSNPGPDPPFYMAVRFRGSGEADAGWVIVLWDKLFQNVVVNLLRKTHLEKKIVVRGRNLEGYRTLAFQARGAEGGESLGVGVKWIALDRTTHEVKLLLTHRRSVSCWAGPIFPLPAPLSTDWQEVRVPLTAFGPVDWSSVENLSFFWKGCFDERASQEGITLYLAEIRFEK